MDVNPEWIPTGRNAVEKNNAAEAKSTKTVDSTLKELTHSKTSTKITFGAIVLLYFIVTFITTATARSQGTVMFFGLPAPVSSFTGIFSSLANICIILLVVFFGKFGYIVSLTLLIVQFPLQVYNMLERHSLAAVPGIFTSILTIVAITIIYLNNRKIARYQQRMRDQAVTDSLTGLPNHFACTELCEDLAKHNAKFAVVSIDLNNFKSINDTMGHEMGNQVLIEVAHRWKELAESWRTGTRDFISRLGADDFSLVIQGCGSDADIRRTINTYEKELENKITIDDCDYYLTASYGYCVFPTDTDNVSTVFSGADAALHEIKRLRSSNHICHFSPGLLKTERMLEIERRIRAALDDGEILYHLQPQYNINHQLRGFEALARLQDTDESFIAPSEFIPIAEKTGLIDRVDMAVFRQAATFLGKRLTNQDMDITLSVNISVRHLMRNNFIEELREILRTCGLRSDHLEIEITESIMIDSAEKALRRIDEVKRLGIKIAIDDFGTGYSSLSYLSNLPADLLKIDKSFIDQMNTSDSYKQYVATIISIGHILGFKVISEGVETEEQLETLRQIGCDLIQGFVWGRPVAPEVAAKLIPNEE